MAEKQVMTEESIHQLVVDIEAEGENLGYKGNKLQCYIKQQVKNIIQEVKDNND